MKTNTDAFIQKMKEIKQLIISDTSFDDEEIKNHVEQLDQCFSEDFSEIVTYFQERYTAFETLAGDEGIPEHLEEAHAEVATFFMFLEHTQLDEKTVALLINEDFEDDDDISIDDLTGTPIQ